ncbi:MAG: AMP-binding protein [Flavobacteriales bacterium]|nr:AMP-binding protein [Flavobacteriales bacterium]
MYKIDFSLNKDEVLKAASTYKDIWSNDILLFLQEWWDDNSFITAETSGSTGIPKKIVLDKEKVINSAKATGTYFKLKKGDNALLCMSPKYIAGKLMIVRSMVWEMKLICIEPSSSPLKSIPENMHIDFAAMVPLQVKNSIYELQSKRISNLIIGGGAIDYSLLSKIKKSSTNIFSSYGMTESITHIALKKLNGENPDTYYKALKDVYFSIDKRNCLIIDAKNVSDDDIVTNDIIELINNRAFRWLGRIDNVINCGGVKIHPEKIESILSEHIPSPFFISSIKDETFGEKPVLFIEGKQIHINLDELKKLLPKYHSPKEIFFIDNFVRTDSGKIKRIESAKGKLN